ncbi:nucleotidyl transferase AbiEii/AbiGii toxin family protein [Ghiorsea bivora]|uniref:nucleotidyl transferase AbiEii/AbiGii toxin family protein n=1 Tax=Ghiorsea bivora TaxID=1485545 RepID=UPI000AD3CD8D
MLRLSKLTLVLVIWLRPLPKKPTVLDISSPKLKAYPVETVIAEKFEAMVSIGFTNSRMKDFYDIWAIYKFLNLNNQVVNQAIANTFRRR